MAQYSDILLTVDYDKSALTFEGFERGEAFRSLQFDYTNTEKGYSAEPFRFYWERATNTMDTGRLLILKFKINHNAEVGAYSVTMTYEPTTDALYVNELGEISYTKFDLDDKHSVRLYLFIVLQQCDLIDRLDLHISLKLVL